MSIIPFPQRPETSFEVLEEACITYLGEAKTPIVPVDVILEYCRRNPALAHVSRSTVVEFLRSHGDIEFLDGPTPEEQISAEMLGNAGLLLGERAVLRRRIPTERELHAHMAIQLQAMREALGNALSAAAPGEALAPKRAEIQAAIAKVDGLLERLSTLMR